MNCWRSVITLFYINLIQQTENLLQCNNPLPIILPIGLTHLFLWIFLIAKQWTIHYVHNVQHRSLLILNALLCSASTSSALILAWNHTLCFWHCFVKLKQNFRLLLSPVSHNYVLISISVILSLCLLWERDVIVS